MLLATLEIGIGFVQVRHHSRVEASRSLRCPSFAAMGPHCIFLDSPPTCTFFENPWTLASVADLRLGADRRSSIALTLARTRSCKLEPFFARPLKDAIKDEADQLTQPAWREFIATWACSVRITIAGVEWMHKEHRELAHPQMRWSHFSACVVNKELRVLCAASRIHAKALQDNMVQSGGVPVQDAAEANPGRMARDERKRRRKSAFQLFRCFIIEREKRLGKKVRITSPEFVRMVSVSMPNRVVL